MRTVRLLLNNLFYKSEINNLPQKPSPRIRKTFSHSTDLLNDEEENTSIFMGWGLLAGILLIATVIILYTPPMGSQVAFESYTSELSTVPGFLDKLPQP